MHAHACIMYCHVGFLLRLCTLAFHLAGFDQADQWDNPHVAYKGKVYDITDYVNQHPGGREQIMIAAGRDMTQLFHSYHKDHVASLIEKKCKYVGDLVSDEMPAFLPENGNGDRKGNSIFQIERNRS